MLDIEHPSLNLELSWVLWGRAYQQAQAQVLTQQMLSLVLAVLPTGPSGHFPESSFPHL